MTHMLRIVIIWIGKFLQLLTRMRGGGSAFPGLVVERLYPEFIQTLHPHFSQVVLVTGTNGKTTTTKMLREILHSKYDNIVHNQAGSNMSRGVISSALEAMDWRGRLRADVGLFEVDEGYATKIAAMLRPDIFVALNLHRDQLDRYGELERINELLTEAAQHAKHTVLNYDDTRLRSLMDNLVSFSGVSGSQEIQSQVPSDDRLGRSEETERKEATNDPEIFIESAEFIDGRQSAKLRIGGEEHELSLKIPGVFNIYNAAVALEAGLQLGVDTEKALEILSTVEPAFGRSEEVRIDGKTLQLLLVKNPSGFNQVIMNFLNPRPEPVLFVINDNFADGRDVSWLWDVDIESLDMGGEPVLTSGTRGYDMCLRLQYADIEAATDPDIKEAIDRLIEQIPEGGRGYIVPTYTAMLSIRKQLKKFADMGSTQ